MKIIIDIPKIFKDNSEELAKIELAKAIKKSKEYIKTIEESKIDECRFMGLTAVLDDEYCIRLPHKFIAISGSDIREPFYIGEKGKWASKNEFRFSVKEARSIYDFLKTVFE